MAHTVNNLSTTLVDYAWAAGRIMHDCKPTGARSTAHSGYSACASQAIYDGVRLADDIDGLFADSLDRNGHRNIRKCIRNLRSRSWQTTRLPEEIRQEVLVFGRVSPLDCTHPHLDV
jgi:hypothetical protein